VQFAAEVERIVALRTTEAANAQSKLPLEKMIEDMHFEMPPHSIRQEDELKRQSKKVLQEKFIHMKH